MSWRLVASMVRLFIMPSHTIDGNKATFSANQPENDKGLCLSVWQFKGFKSL